MKKYLVYFGVLLFGCVIGICLPFRLIAFEYEIPLLSSWSSFADWLLRVIETFATVLAVIIALFKDDLLFLFKHPDLKTDIDKSTFQSEEILEGKNRVATSYYKSIKVENTGNATAEKCQVIVDSITYKSSDKLKETELVNIPKNVPWQNSGNPTEDISITCNRSFYLFQILPAVKGGCTNDIPERPMSLLIGGMVIPNDHPGGEYIVTIKIEAEKIKPIVFHYKIRWTGVWFNQKSEMEKVLLVSKIK